MPDIKYRIPSNIIRKIRNNAPSYTSSENYGRRGGYYGDSDEYARSYKDICIYVQNGLADKADLFKVIVKAIFKIQRSNTRKYPLLVFGFGDSEILQHENKYFKLGYTNSSSNVTIFSETISRISGNHEVKQAVIPELFPKTGNRSLYQGKTGIDKKDLLIVIGKKNEVFFSDELKDKITHSIKKHILLIEIDNEDVDYIFNPKEINYI